NETATTKSAIGARSITITDGANQKQDVASLNRDTADLNGTVSKLPDLSNLLNQQASTQQAAAIVAQTVATQIGNYADRQKQAAEAAGDQDTADKWKEGGAYRIAMHIAGGAAVAGLGGGSIGSAAQGAAGAGISAAAAGIAKGMSNDIAASSPTGNADADRALGNIIANVIATGAGAAVGGGTGAAAASSVDLYNRSTHDDSDGKKPKDLVAQVCPATVQCSDAMLNTAIQAQGDLAQQASGAMSPNYATLSFGVLSGSAGGVINLDDGTKYLAVGVGQSNPSAISWSPSASSTLGWIWGARTADATNAFLNGDGNQAFVSIPTLWRLNVVGVITHAYGGSTAIEVGVGSPGGISFGIVFWSHSTPVGNK
uniref:polymorphic toxin type 22 domain-containing protein n=1 Tax=Caballeronia sp. GAWG2-1 TaxID=2921744 RepID=UPI0020284855